MSVNYTCRIKPCLARRKLEWKYRQTQMKPGITVVYQMLRALRQQLAPLLVVAIISLCAPISFAATASVEDVKLIARLYSAAFDRDPKADEAGACRRYLERQIELVKPKIIVAVGRIAAQQLLETEATLGSLRGTLHHLGEIPLIVTYHPAYLLRSPAQKRKAWHDLRLALTVAKGSAA